MNRILRLIITLAFVSVFFFNFFVEDCYSVPTLNINQVYTPAGGPVVGPITDYCSYGDDCDIYAESYNAYGAAKGGLKVSNGLEMKSFAYGKNSPYGSAVSRLSMTDAFTLNTISGLSNTTYSAVQSYIFDGSLFVPYVENDQALASVSFNISGNQYGLNSASYGFRLLASYDSRDNADVYGLSVTTSGDSTLLNMASQTDVFDPDIGLLGRQFHWDNISVGLLLEDFQADTQTSVNIGLTTQVSGYGGRSDFFNTFATDTDAPFAITEGPEGVLYQLTTPGATGYDGKSLFGSVELNEEILSAPSSVPIPGTFWLLGSCLIGIAGFRRKFKN